MGAFQIIQSDQKDIGAQVGQAIAGGTSAYFDSLHKGEMRNVEKQKVSEAMRSARASESLGALQVSSNIAMENMRDKRVRDTTNATLRQQESENAKTRGQAAQLQKDRFAHDQEMAKLEYDNAIKVADHENAFEETVAYGLLTDKQLTEFTKAQADNNDAYFDAVGNEQKLKIGDKYVKVEAMTPFDYWKHANPGGYDIYYGAGGYFDTPARMRVRETGDMSKLMSGAQSAETREEAKEVNGAIDMMLPYWESLVDRDGERVISDQEIAELKRIRSQMMTAIVKLPSQAEVEEANKPKSPYSMTGGSPTAQRMWPFVGKDSPPMDKYIGPPVPGAASFLQEYPTPAAFASPTYNKR